MSKQQLYYWHKILTPDDLPENDMGDDYPEKHIVVVPHDDGRGGYHIEEMNFSELSGSWNSVDGYLQYLKPVKP